MRVISQDGKVDVPYEHYLLEIIENASGTHVIFASCCTTDLYALAGYSTEEKALKAMEMLRKTYLGMPIIMQNCEITEDTRKELMGLEKTGIALVSNDAVPKIQYVDNSIFQFPQDEDIKV